MKLDILCEQNLMDHSLQTYIFLLILLLLKLINFLAMSVLLIPPRLPPLLSKIKI